MISECLLGASYPPPSLSHPVAPVARLHPAAQAGPEPQVIPAVREFRSPTHKTARQPLLGPSSIAIQGQKERTGMPCSPWYPLGPRRPGNPPQKPPPFLRTWHTQKTMKRKNRMKSTTTTIMTVPSDTPPPPSPESAGGGGMGAVGDSAAISDDGSSSPFPLPSSMVVTWTPEERVTVSVRKTVSRPARVCVEECDDSLERLLYESHEIFNSNSRVMVVAPVNSHYIHNS
ncbi:hypothetical protein F5B21DRAFT_371005 [Xylaria acuta]|nr:hypothetical protein F5B21DRAFT_371005 [Xylaria acuta]